MSSEFDVIDDRIKRLETLVAGEDISRTDGEQLLDTLLSLQRKLSGVVSKSEKVSSALKRVEEVEKYSDPSYTEADIFIPDAVKYQLVASEEQRLKDALENFEKIETLKHVLDSQAIADVPQMESRLSKLISVQASQELQVSKLTTETYSLLQSYNDLVNSLSENLAQLELKVSTTKKPK